MLGEFPVRPTRNDGANGVGDVGRSPIVEIVDWYGESVESDELFRADGYHPNAVGSERWANLIVAKIKGPGE